MKINLTPNEGSIDRIIRALASVAFAVGGLATQGWLQMLLFVFAGILAVTSLTGFCGLYTLLGISTCPRKTPKKE